MSIDETALNLVYSILSEMPYPSPKEAAMISSKKIAKWYCKSKMKTYGVELQKENGLREGLELGDGNFAVAYASAMGHKRVQYYERLIKFWGDVGERVDDLTF